MTFIHWAWVSRNNYLYNLPIFLSRGDCYDVILFFSIDISLDFTRYWNTSSKSAFNCKHVSAAIHRVGLINIIQLQTRTCYLLGNIYKDDREIMFFIDGNKLITSNESLTIIILLSCSLFILFQIILNSLLIMSNI